MDTFSLEDEDVSGMFITQESTQNVSNLGINEDNEDDSIFGIASDDFSSPCVSLVSCNVNYNPEVSDISDGEVEFQKPKPRYIIVRNIICDTTVKMKCINSSLVALKSYIIADERI